MNDVDEEQSILNNEIKRVKYGIIPDERGHFPKNIEYHIFSERHAWL